MRILRKILLTLVIGMISCKEEEPLDLAPFEPFVNIAFYDSQNQPVKTLIEQVTTHNSTSFSFSDSSTTYKFPLDINSTFTSFEITGGDKGGSLTVNYNSRIENQVNVLRFIMENITVSAHSYDSVNVICEPPCASNETEIRIYK